MMALESIASSETVIQSNDNEDDLEDGEIPSDEDDEPVPVVSEPAKLTLAAAAIPTFTAIAETPKSQSSKKDDSRHKNSETDKSSKSNKSGSEDKFSRQKGGDDWAGDVEKAIRAALDEDRGKNDGKSSRSKSKSKSRKRDREEKEDERFMEHKKKKISDEENLMEDDDDLLFVRGASPLKKGPHGDISPRRERDNYNSGSDFEDRPNRHRDDKRGAKWSQSKAERNGKKAPPPSRRSLKNDRLGGVGKNKTRAQLRNERNGRRNQANDLTQDPDEICMYYMQGKCHRGNACPFSHDALPPRKMELCKFYLMDCCAKRDKCLYMHHDFPCKFFHTGSKCNAGENCKFSHEPMSEQVKNILLKHLETAPKEILGNFPRLNRESALCLINNTEKYLLQGQDNQNSKIPSLFEVKVPTMNDDHGRDDGDDRDRGYKDHRKGSSGKKTRWGSNDDRVPIDMLMQSASQLGLLNKQVDKPAIAPAANFYNDVNEIKKDVETEKPKDDPTATIASLTKDVDLRQLLLGVSNKSQIVNLAEKAALTKSKIDEESDRDDEANLVIEDPGYEEDKSKEQVSGTAVDDTKIPTFSVPEIPSNLPKKTQELYMRIQQQQREAEDSFKNLENTENQEITQDDWYSDDDDDDDDERQLTIVDSQKDEEEEEEKKDESKEEEETTTPLPPAIPQPAAIVDKIGDFSKIDISMEVSKLLSSIKAQSSSSHKQDKDLTLKNKKESNVPSIEETSKPTTRENSPVQVENSSPVTSFVATTTTTSAPVSRDPRMSRDPRHRREDSRIAATNTIPALPAVKSEAKDSHSLRLETSIYSLGIIALDTDTDLRAKLDQDHRRKDMDLRCFPPGPSFGDTDLRLVGGHYPDAAKSGDVDLRQMLSLPFKPVPSHVPCTEIEAGLNTHPPIHYKVYVVDVPRPDYTGLKLTRNDPQVRYDPRLRKIFRLSKDDLADSPMSPPPLKMLDTPKSPPLVRVDPRRKALETHTPKIIPTTVQQHPIQDSLMPGLGMNMVPNMPPPYMSGQGNMPLMQGMNQDMNREMNRDMGRDMNQDMGREMNRGMQQGMGPPMMMSGNSLMGSGGIAPLMRDGPGMAGNGVPGPMGPSGMRMGGMGPNISHQQMSMPGPGQMNQYDRGYSGQRTGLLGAGPGPLPGYNQDVRPQYDMPGRGYPPDNFNNYGPNGPNSDRGDPRGFNSNGPMDDSGYGGPGDWNSDPSKVGRKDGRRQTRRGMFSGMPRRKNMP